MTPYAERFVRTIKSECLNKMLILGEGHLRHIVSSYCDYYHHRRPHQGLDNNMIEPLPQDKEFKSSILTGTLLVISLIGLYKFWYKKLPKSNL